MLLLFRGSLWYSQPKPGAGVLPVAADEGGSAVRDLRAVCGTGVHVEAALMLFRVQERTKKMYLWMDKHFPVSTYVRE